MKKKRRGREGGYENIEDEDEGKWNRENHLGTYL